MVDGSTDLREMRGVVRPLLLAATAPAAHEHR